jgi:glycerol-3-phosphate dehydrogenase
MTQTTTSQPRHQEDYDVIIIGAGIVGSMIARELCRYEGRFALLEKEPFSGFGVSKANPCMLHSPLMFIFLAFDSDHLAKLNTARAWADDNHVSADHAIIGPEKLRQIEPNASKKAIGALYGKGVSGGIYATEWTFALTENAVQNGLDLYLNSAVTDIKCKGDFDFEVITSRGRLKTRYIINTAGLFVDEIAGMVGDTDIQLVLTKGTMLILDKSASNLLGNMIYGTYGKDHSELVTPTAHGNLLIGLGYFTKPAHKGDTAVSRDKLQEVLHMGKKLVPAISEKGVITAFAGIRSQNNMAPGGDFYIDHSRTTAGVIHAAIGSPGLTAAPAIAEYLINLLAAAGLELEENKTFNPNRIGWHRFETATATEKHRLIESNSKYGHIVCRCEKVSEAEVLEAIRRGANSMDAVKHVTRAGMGRCQGGFCGISVLNYLTREQNVDPGQVTKNGIGSHQVTAFRKSD